MAHPLIGRLSTRLLVSFSAVLSLLFLFLAGCTEPGRGSGGSSSQKPGGDAAAPPSTAQLAKSSAAEADPEAQPKQEAPLDPNALVVALDADMSSSSAEAGEAIRRGALLAIDEINKSGGILGRPLELIVRDHRGNPARGVDNIESLASLPNLVAVLAGLNTPVALAELEPVHRHQIVYLVPWAAGTPVIDHNYKPSFTFRVSVRDELAGIVMVNHAVANGCTRPGLLLERTSWGRSNEGAINKALSAHGHPPTRVEWFDFGPADMTKELQTLIDGGAGCIILVSNPLEGLSVIRSLASMPEKARRPLITHWGIIGGGRPFFRSAQPFLEKVDLVFLQSFSFLNPKFPPRAERVFEMYRGRFKDATSVRDIFSPAGTAQAFDLVHLLALAIGSAKKTDRAAIRDALERINHYSGLIRDYDPPFTSDRHDALTVDDLQMCRFGTDGSIQPIEPRHDKAPR